MVEFEYRNEKISHLICDCLCSYTCKHEFAAMLQLRETLELIDKHYSEEFERTGYFVADRYDHSPEHPVFNRAVGLRDSWAKMNK